MIPRLVATQFHRYMGSGRTRPVLCTCQGAGDAGGDFVIKLRGCLEHGTTGLAFELLASQLATYFGIPTPAPAVVALDRRMIELMAPRAVRTECVRASTGDNFGSAEIRGGATVPVDLHVPPAEAGRMIAFDALIQNPDRRFNNPNLLLQGDRILALDHELAFSFVFGIAPSPEPWKLTDPYPFDQHVLFRSVKGRVLDLQGFTSKLAGLSPEIIAAMQSELPQEWENQHMAAIARYLAVMSAHAVEFIQGVGRRLA